MLARIDVLASGPAPLDLLGRLSHAGCELSPAIERGHHDMPALTALRVIPVVAHDETPQSVVIGVGSCHGVKSRITDDTEPRHRVAGNCQPIRAEPEIRRSDGGGSIGTGPASMEATTPGKGP